MDPDSAAYAPDHPAAIDVERPLVVSPTLGIFEGYPKTPRLNRHMIVTEKIDGTNAAIVFEEQWLDDDQPRHVAVWAQSRKRTIRPGKSTDNAGFAAWVIENRYRLFELLGPGRHFGEWYGPGIQGNPYGVEQKRFALFNVHRWADTIGEGGGYVGDALLHTVPVLYAGPFSTHFANGLVNELRATGSRVPGAEGRPAEGIIVYHTASRQVYKVTLDNDEMSKGEAEARAAGRI